REVMTVPVQYPTSFVGNDDNMLREKPCLCPDPIRPVHYNGMVNLPLRGTICLWLDIQLPESFPAGEDSLAFTLNDTQNKESVRIKIKVLSQKLPKQRLIHTEWFYSDCIAEAYHTRPFSQKHWKYLESYISAAVRNGINMILTPVFTPELDTYIGGERPTTQLVKITVTDKDKYEFDFSLLDRWIALCKRCGVEYYEIPHFFTQWGAEHAPKFVARVNGRTKRIFGWETDSMGKEYKAFLSQLIPALIDCLKKNGVDKNCFFHVSDEPSLNSLPHYKECREFLTSCLGDYNIIDALSEYEFYETGAISKPVPHIKSLEPFMKNNVPGLWTYYCGNPTVITGRCMTMPAYRTRILGVQLWKANIEGFLHWGYNFYHNQNSYDYVDPFSETGGEYFAPAGDAFLVYPGTDGTAWESIRLNALREAVDDMRALDLLAEKKGRAFAVKLIDDTAKTELTFTDYPRNADFLYELRKKIAEEIEK
ncbi:MAG: DUF4091 domain-containing protein, partial [Clostridia bacterium]|nr:DUF4091 domain-containing protein [Clostridia bacterium]